MLNKTLFAIIIAMLGLVMANSAFGQWHPEIDRVKSPRDVASGQATGIKSPRDVASGQVKSQINAKTQKPNAGFMDYTDDACSVCDGKIKATAIKSPRDMATGQATGKRQHEPIQAQDKLGNFEIQDLKATPKQVQPGQNSGGTISNQRTKSNSQEKLGNFEIQDIKSPRDAASGQATGKRQYEPVRNYNLGDTATHEVGHKQRKRGKN